MAADILIELEAQRRLPEHYFILEVSADLHRRQRRRHGARARHNRSRVQWLDGWPADLRGVVLANEVLDAMPVKRCIRGTQVNAIGVTWRSDA